MEINKGIKRKIFFLFSIMGIIPFTILVIIGAITTVSEMEDAVKNNSMLRNAIISEHVTEHLDKNMYVLKTLSLNREIIQYLQSPTENGLAVVEKILHDTNEIFEDTSLMALTDSNAQQHVRTDGATLVNIKNRQHFREAMKGRPYISDIMSSMSTGKMIIVVEVPVFDAEGNPIGLVQRNFDLIAMQDFVESLGDNEISVVVMDRTGRVIANSDNVKDVGNEYVIDQDYKFILEKVYNSSGVIHIKFNDEEALATYSRNIDTGWMIVTIRPYRYIMDQVYEKVIKAIVFGLIILFIGILLAYLLTIRVTKPIIEMTNVVDEIVSGNARADNINISSNDEIGQMAAAFNKIRSQRDAFQLESELDKLTELYNKKMLENLCRTKLETFNENESSNIFMALYIIDLDHFKEVNDSHGHQFGDKVLIAFADELRRIFRSNDCIGRFGGDEFVVSVDNMPNIEKVLQKAELIRKAADKLEIDGYKNVVTASIGIATAPQNGRDYESLFEAADKALYYVKNNGRNNYRCWDEDESIY